MKKKNNQKEQAENQNDQWMTVEFIGITLENFTAHVYCGITGCMREEKRQHEQPCSCHY